MSQDFSWGDTATHLLCPGRESTTTQSTDTIKLRLGVPLNCIGITYGSVGEGLLTGTRMTQSPPWHGQQLTKLGTLYSLQSAQLTGECWSGLNLLCSFTPLRFIFAAQLAWVFLPGQLFWESVFFVGQLPSVSGELSIFIAYCGREGLSESGEFPELPEANLNSFNLGGNCFTTTSWGLYQSPIQIGKWKHRGKEPESFRMCCYARGSPSPRKMPELP